MSAGNENWQVQLCRASSKDSNNQHYSLISCCDECPEQSRPFVCSEPIPMKITCVQKPAKDDRPIGRITRNQDMDLIGGKFVYRCFCSARNGLSNDCRRVSCRNNPACNMLPQPKCWPQYKPKPDILREINGFVRLCYKK